MNMWNLHISWKNNAQRSELEKIIKNCALPGKMDTKKLQKTK